MAGSEHVFSERERSALSALARAAIPAGRVFPAAGEDTVRKFEAALSGRAGYQKAFRSLLRTLDARALMRTGRPLSRLSPERLTQLLESWRRGGFSTRIPLRAMVTPLKAMHFDDPAFYRAIGCVYEREKPQSLDTPGYVAERSHDAEELAPESIDADVVVVGTGAGGAACAKELAEAGLAVVMLEEGHFYDRSDFAASPLKLQRTLYRNGGATLAFGNCVIPVPIGVTVGGTTTINSGTCYRAPGRILKKWRDDFGLRDLTDSAMDGYYDRVEAVLRVEPAKRRFLGGAARVVGRGCDTLGYTQHGPLARNAPDCDGQGVCCFGCPTDAKRSTNVSYVPLALRAGAELIYGARVDSVIVEGDRAAGVVATSKGGARLEVRARAVVISCGSLMTPVLLQRQQLLPRSSQLGRNLSIHPAQAVLARFDESIAGYNAIPQGYTIEEFHDEGLLFEGGSTPLDITMTALPFMGSQLTSLAEDFERVAMFGFLIEDESRGQVSALGRQPVIRYWVDKRDVERLRRGVDILSRIYFAAGATEVLPLVHGFDYFRSEEDLQRFRRARLRPSDFELSGYHPLGTARMGASPSIAVVDSDNESFELSGLFIVDGSAIPSSVAVNPQVTIMAIATRAAERIARRLL